MSSNTLAPGSILSASGVKEAEKVSGALGLLFDLDKKNSLARRTHKIDSQIHGKRADLLVMDDILTKEEHEEQLESSKDLIKQMDSKIKNG